MADMQSSSTTAGMPANTASGRSPLPGVLFAVADGPDGGNVIELVDDRDQALRVRAQHHGEFWCSTQASGCGGRLVLAAGEKVRPYFRHLPGEGTSCALAHDPQRAERSYAHLRYQLALSAWLRDQGLEPVIEKTLGADGRADLHVRVEGVEHTIEVQLSPLSISTWRERNERYSRSGRHVTWLFGPLAQTARTGQADRDLPTFSIASAAELTCERSREEFHSSEQVRLATHGTDEHWSSLGACRLQVDGIWTPDLEAARSDLAEAAAQRAAESSVPDEPESVAPAQIKIRPTTPPAAPRRPVLFEEYRRPAGAFSFRDRTVSTWQQQHPESHHWSPQQGWGWSEHLSGQDRVAARFFAYLACRIYAAGPIGMFQVPEVSDLEAVLGAMVGTRLIELDEADEGKRWQRCESLRV